MVDVEDSPCRKNTVDSSWFVWMLRSVLQLALHSCEHKAKELLKHQEWGGVGKPWQGGHVGDVLNPGGAPKRMVYNGK